MKGRLTLAFVAMGALALFIAACTEEVIKEVPVEKEVVVEKEVIKEVPVEKIVEKVVVKEVPVEKIVEKEVIKEVEVEKEVVKRVVREVVATAMPLTGGLAVEQAKYGGELKVVAQSSIKTLDLRIGPAVTIAVALHMHNQLFAWDKDFTSQPQAVDTWSLSPDGLTYRFNLRRDLTFHDGSPVTTADVVPSFKPWLTQLTGRRVATFAADADNVMEAVDDHTLQVRLAKPFCCLLASLTPAGRFGGVVYPKRIAELDAAKDVGEGNYVGAGPYKLKSWEVGNKVTIERYDGYVPRSEPGSFLAGAQISYFDKITWLEIPSEETKIAGLKTGEWDVVDDPALDFYTDLKDSAGITTVVNRPGKLSGVVFRHDTSPSDNKLVRQAILAAVEVKPFMFSLTSEEDLWTHCASAFTCFHADAITTGGWTKHYDQNDLEKAKQLLAQSGYDGEEFLLMNPNDYGTITPLGPVFKAMMEDIGINVDMPGMDWSTLISRRFSDFPWNAFTLWGSFPFMYQPLFNAYVGVGGYKKYESGGMESLLNQYGSTFDSAEQQRIAGELMDVYYDEVPSIHFGQFFGIVPHSDRVKGLTSRIYTAYTNAYLGD